MKRTAIAAAALILGACVQQTATTPASKPTTRQQQQIGSEVLFWSQEQRDRNFPGMEALFPGTVVRAGGRVRPLSSGMPLAIADAEVDAHMAANNMVGLIVLHDGKIRLERYARGLTRQGRWTSFSVAKSFTSTLVGAAIRDGYIRSVDDPIVQYIPELAGSGYDGVTIAQLLTMTSGVRWNEDYTDPQSDVARMFSIDVPPGMDATVAYMRTLPRETVPGTKWVYKTGETNLIGVLVSKATGKPLARYLSEKIWRRYGMERDAFWMTGTTGGEVGGCCLSIALRDYARMGQLVLDGGEGIVPPGWFAEATRPHVANVRPGTGYGYQWWTYPENRFGANGIFGQSITIDPAARVVVVVLSAWPKASDPKLGADRAAFVSRLIALAKD